MNRIGAEVPLPPMTDEEGLIRWTLPNGIRCVHKQVDSPVAHLGFFINVGSRDELPHEHGLAHFIEHTIFKGTTHRKAYHILSRLEDVGGELNAYTTKEETVIHASFLSPHYDRSIELFHDIVFNSIFPPKELEKEKAVIIDEINSYLDSPSDMIFDEFEELLFNDDPIGRNSLGTPESVRSFTAGSVREFISRGYHTDRMVLSSVGRIDIRKLQRMVERTFGLVPPSSGTDQRIPFSGYRPQTRTETRSNFQEHVLMGNIAYAADHEDRIGLYMLSNILGGPGLNARLNMSLREKHGYTYSVESGYSTFSDTGMFSIYFGTDAQYLEKCMKLVKRELKQMRDTALGSLQLHKAKQQLLGQVAIAEEHNASQMLGFGRSILLFDRIHTLAETAQRIEAITSSELLRIANEMLNEQDFSCLIYRSS
jgi:predicted Zn-dependent peptidase